MKTLAIAAAALFLTATCFADSPSRASDAPTINIEKSDASRAQTDREPSVMATAMRVSDLDRSLRFYTQGLGMVVLGKIESRGMTEVMLNFPGRAAQAGLIVMSKTGQSAAVEHGNADTKIILNVPNAAALAAKLKDAGYAVGDFHQNGPYKILMIQDPDGYRYEIVERGAVSERQ